MGRDVDEDGEQIVNKWRIDELCIAGGGGEGGAASRLPSVLINRRHNNHPGTIVHQNSRIKFLGKQRDILFRRIVQKRESCFAGEGCRLHGKLLRFSISPTASLTLP